MGLSIQTNRHDRLFLYGYELPEDIKTDYDYLEDLDSENFIKYRGVYYSLSDFMRIDHNAIDPDLAYWDGVHSDSFFSGVLIKLSNCGDGYQIATYYSD